MAQQKKRPRSDAKDAPIRVHAQSYSLVPVDSIQRHPENPYQGDKGSIAESLDVNGFFGAVLVQKSSGNILAGNHRWETAKEKKLQEIPCLTLDVDDEDAKRILVADNETAKGAIRKEGAFEKLIRSFKNPRGLGIPKTTLDKLLKSLKPAAELLQGPMGGGSDEGDGDGGSGKAAKAEPTGAGKYPLSIVLSAPELRRWEATKKKLGKTKDRDALLALIG